MITPNRADVKRKQLRERLWPQSQHQVWKSSGEKGYFCGPRSLSLLLRLAKEKAIVGSQNCTTVYIDLLSRTHGQGIVEITSLGEHAYFAGYDGGRAIRSWQERIYLLEKAGFIKIKPKPNQKIGYVLIVHPHLVATQLREKGVVTDEWWGAFTKQNSDTGASKPAISVAERMRKLARARKKRKKKSTRKA